MIGGSTSKKKYRKTKKRKEDATNSSPTHSISLSRLQSHIPSISMAGIADLTHRIKKIGEHCIGGGRYGDVYKGVRVDLATPLSERMVAIKVIRPMVANKDLLEKVIKQLSREIRVWQDLEHDNILPFLGICHDFGRIPALISSWMENGQLNEYLASHLEADKGMIAHGVARGLHYLHTRSPQITHGDIKTANTLVDDTGNPRLSDFGLSRMLSDASLWITTTENSRGSLRWMAPELIDGNAILPTPATDVYAFAMTVLEIFTGKVPYHANRIDAAVAMQVVLHNRKPTRPPEMGVNNSCGVNLDGIWDLLVQCWDHDPQKRPSMSEVQMQFQSIGPYRSFYSDAEECVEELFAAQNLFKAGMYFKSYPSQFHPALIGRLFAEIFTRSKADVESIADLFSMVANQNACSTGSFEEGIAHRIHILGDVGEEDMRRAYKLVAEVLIGARLSRDVVERLANRIDTNSNHLIPPRQQLLREFDNLADVTLTSILSPVQKKRFQLFSRYISQQYPKTPSAATRGDSELELEEDEHRGEGASERLVWEYVLTRKMYAAGNQLLVIDLDEVFKTIPSEYHPLLVDHILFQVLISSEFVATPVASNFSRAVKQNLCSAANLEKGFARTYKVLDDISMHRPAAYKLMAVMLRGTTLSRDAVHRLVNKASIPSQESHWDTTTN